MRALCPLISRPLSLTGGVDTAKEEWSLLSLAGPQADEDPETFSSQFSTRTLSPLGTLSPVV